MNNISEYYRNKNIDQLNPFLSYSLPQKLVAGALIISAIAFIALSSTAIYLGSPLIIGATCITGALLIISSLAVIANRIYEYCKKRNPSSNKTAEKETIKPTDKPTIETTIKPIDETPTLSNSNSTNVKRLYNTLPSAQDLKNITFILDALGNWSFWKLTTSGNEIKEAGRKFPSIHCLRFLSTAINTPTLRENFKKIKGYSFVRSHMCSDYQTKLNREDSQNNLKCYIDQFAADIKVDAHKLHALANKKDWSGFFDTVIDSI
jgi:hypothetical protein